MNFSFLNAAALWALPLCLAPLLLHLLLRRPPKTVLFSDLKFLRKVFARRRPRKKLQERLILLFRILALLSFLLFFARPVFRWGGSGGEGDASAVVVLLDASYSMRFAAAGLSDWERSIEMAGGALSSLREKDRSALIVFSDRIDFFSGYLGNEHAKLKEDLAALKPGWRTTRIWPALESAYRLLANSAASNKVILILSDMAPNGWQSLGSPTDLRARIPAYDPNVRLIHSRLPKREENAALTRLDLLADLNTGFVKAQSEIQNHGVRALSSLPVILSLEEGEGSRRFRRESETAAALAGLEKKTVSLSLSGSERDILAGRVSLQPDAQTADDLLYFAQPAPEKIRVLCVEEPAGIAALSGESYYLRQALVSPPSQFEVRTVTVAELKNVSLRGSDVVVLVNPGEMGTESLAPLESYLRGGGSLLLTLGGRAASLGEGFLAEFLPCGLLDVRQTASLPLVFEGDPEKPEWSDFKTGYDWDKLRLERIVQPSLHDNARPWLLLGDGTPVLILSGEGRVAVWTSSIDRSWSNLPSKPVFAPLCRTLVQFLAGRSGAAEKSSLKVGETFVKKFGRPLFRDSVEILSPSGNPIDFKAAESRLESAPLEEPGLYTLIEKGGIKSLREEFAVNVDAESGESGLSALTDSDLEKILPESAWVALRPGERFKEDFSAALRGRELSRPLLFLGALFLLAELLLLQRKKDAEK